MKTYKIHLIRHALTQGNLDGRYIGRTDEPLCEEGIKQLRNMAEDMGYPSVDIVITGSLKRCKETAAIIYPDKMPVEMRGFDECSFGEFENHTAEELQPYEEFAQWLAGGEDARPLSGESNREFASRITETFKKTVEGLMKTSIHEVALITHGGVIATILSAFGVPEQSMTDWLCPACCGYTICIDTNIWKQFNKFEVIDDVPPVTLSQQEEENLWDYYRNPTEEELDEWYRNYMENEDE